ncbi:MAG TPA: PCYCGC motif-containing (lipo)protein [Chloroflexia bacterium]|nr:PCYCGC motif-containing (lipo)protein [Chloroflexia bacterium]
MPSLQDTPQVARTLHVRTIVAVCLPLFIAVAIAGCGDQPTGGSGAAPAAGGVMVHVTTTVAPNKRVPDPKEGAEDTPYALGTTPQFLVNLKSNQKDTITARYAFAAAHNDAFSKIPCYCGCALYEHAHTSLASCYLRSVAADGKVVYTDHSTSCDICTGEADMIMKLLDTTPLADLRAQIDKKYQYTGVWTDTPPIQ